MMKKKVSAAIITFLLVAIFFAGDLPRRDLRATAQVAGIALDQEQDGLVATFEIYDADINETIGAKRKIAVGRGKSLEECIANILYTYGKELFISDASVIVIGEENNRQLLQKVLDFYCIYKNDRMDLPVFFARGEAGAVFSGEGEIISMDLAESARRLGCTQTIKDLMNGRGQHIYLRGKDDGYEIQK